MILLVSSHSLNVKNPKLNGAALRISQRLHAREMIRVTCLLRATTPRTVRSSPVLRPSLARRYYALIITAPFSVTAPPTRGEPAHYYYSSPSYEVEAFYFCSALSSSCRHRACTHCTMPRYAALPVNTHSIPVRFERWSPSLIFQAYTLRAPHYYLNNDNYGRGTQSYAGFATRKNHRRDRTRVRSRYFSCSALLSL